MSRPLSALKTLLICHSGSLLDREGMARWLASFSNLVGIVVLTEGKRQLWRRIHREISRSGLLRFGDVLVFRLYYSLCIASKDRKWELHKLDELCRVYSPLPQGLPILGAESPNTTEVEAFIRKLEPDIMVARCKRLLNHNIFAIPSKGTFVLHAGICPEYRNAHGCFWALANGDLNKVGMTLLRIDKGVDTGPVYGYFTYPFDEVGESHFIIQNRVVFDNLDLLQGKLSDIYRGEALPLDTSNRPSAVWGQPRFTSYLKWKYQARRRQVFV